MKKRNLMVFSSIALAVILIAGGTLAWFTANAEVDNSFTAGTLDIEVEEKFNPEETGNVNPGDEFEKEVKINNLGSKRAYVRVKLTAAWGLAEGKEFQEGFGADVLAPAELVGLDLTNWVKIGDYYYYKHIVAAETGATSNLITGVKFAGASMGDEYQGASFNLNVEAEAIQVTNGAITDAWGINPADHGIEVLAP